MLNLLQNFKECLNLQYQRVFKVHHHVTTFLELSTHLCYCFLFPSHQTIRLFQYIFSIRLILLFVIIHIIYLPTVVRQQLRHPALVSQFISYSVSVNIIQFLFDQFPFSLGIVQIFSYCTQKLIFKVFYKNNCITNNRFT